MKIKKIILTALCFILLFPQTATAEDTAWKEYLREFLINDFPSLFDKATIKKNEELFKKWQESYNPDNYTCDYIPVPDDIPIDAISEWMPNNAYYPLLLPYECKFYDLDFDGTPEVIITYQTSAGEGHLQYIYKLNSNKFEDIYFEGTSFELYTNSQNKVVMFEGFYTSLYAIYFIEIKNGKLTLNDYIDSNGSKIYNGRQYGNLNIEWGNISINDLTPLLEFDCSDVVAAAKNSVYSPKTGDNYLMLFAVFVIIGFTIKKFIKIKR